MSSSFVWYDAEAGHEGAAPITFFYNSDLSGPVTVYVDSVAVDHMISPPDPGENWSQSSVQIPGEALVEFLAEWVRRGRIQRLEVMSEREVLGL